jgi:transposase
MAFPVYPSDLNDAEWALLAPLIPTSKPHGRPRSSDMRRITNRRPLIYMDKQGGHPAVRCALHAYGVFNTV